MDPIRHYFRKEIQKEILNSAENREVGVSYGLRSFGKRPDVLMYEGDIVQLVKQGATSFHISLERWRDPLELSSGMTKKQLDELRIGWDLLFDVDCKFIEYSKIAANLISEAFKYNDIDNIGIKFSGGSGFHILLPYESFPKKINDKDAKLLFPEGIKVVASYIMNKIEDPLRERILELNSLNELSKTLSIDKEKLTKNNVLNPFKIIEIDSILISSRHLFRSPYSLNEKTGLVSIPLSHNELKNFDIKKAKVENVEVNESFIPKAKEEEASTLIIQAFDWYSRQDKGEEVKINKDRTYVSPTIKIQEKYFPECIKKLSEGVDKDGRKRAVFILINFLRQMNWEFDEIENFLQEWNSKNYEELRKGYIKAQIGWHKKQNKKLLPPNCSNESYYFDLGIKCHDNVCNRCKNPVNFSFMKLKSNKKTRKSKAR